MKAFRFFKLILPSFAVLLLSCSKDNDDSTPIQTIPDVYTCGYENNGAGINVAKYWKNENPYILSDGKYDARAVAITVSGTDVYACGYEYVGYIMYAKYWKNGVAVNLTDGKYPASANDIVVSGTDVYVCGGEFNGTTYIAKYWKNGAPIILSDGAMFASANGITVVNGDVYICGYDGRQLKYWKNSAAIKLKDTPEGLGKKIAVSENSVYITAEQDYYKKTVCLKDGIPTVLVADSPENASVNGITISNKDVYVSGTEINVAKYWKNGSPVSLTDGTNSAYANGIAVSGNDIYVAGGEYTDNSNTISVAKYWKNGKAVCLTDGTRKAGLSDIVVQ